MVYYYVPTVEEAHEDPEFYEFLDDNELIHEG